MKVTKKLLSVLLSLLIVLSTISSLGMVSYAEENHTHNYVNYICECGTEDLEGAVEPTCKESGY